MALKFFLNADGGALAFKKVSDVADYDNSVYVADAHSTMTSLTANPPSVNPTYALNVKLCAEAMVLINPAATATVAVYLGFESGNIAGWFAPPGNSYAVTGKTIVGINTQGADYLTIVVTASTGNVGVELIPIPYEETE